MRILLVFLAFLGWMFAAAQTPTNNTCANASSLLFDQEGRICVVNQNTTPTASGFDSGTNGACSEAVRGPDMFYRFTAVAPTLTVNLNALGAESIKRPLIHLFRGKCNNPILISCARELGNNPAELNATITPGQPYFLVISSEIEEFGDFELCVTNNSATDDPGDRCEVAGRLCNKATVEFEDMSSYQSSGFRSACFSYVVRKDVWLSWTVARSGSCEFLIDPMGNTEYDWALYDITDGCPTEESEAITCNYNYSNNSGAPTGIATNPNSFPVPGEISEVVNVIQGRSYALLIDNWSNNNLGFSLEWGGTFEIISSDFELSRFQGCDSLEVDIDHPVLIDHRYLWDFGNGNTFVGANPPSQKYTQPGSYLISLNVNSANNNCNSTSSALVTVSDPKLTSNFTDTTVCGAQELTLLANAELTELQSPVSFTNRNDRSIPDNSSDGIISSLEVSIEGNPKHTEESIQGICLSLEHANLSDLTLELEAPNGKRVTLIRNNGALTSDLRNTCFSDASTISIDEGQSPYPGTFMPKDPLSSLAGDFINGTWSLRIKDEAPGIKGLLDSWTLAFNNENQPTFAWSPGEFFSDSTQALQKVSVSPNGNSEGKYDFQLDLIDRVGCSRSKNITVNVVERLFAGDTGRVTRCTESIKINLFDYLEQGYEPGGYWRGVQSNTNLNDVSGDLNLSGYTSGVYEFIYALDNISECAETTGHVFVSLEEKQNAGKDTSVNVCSNSVKVNLFELLGGNPDPGGVWEDLNGTGNFNPATQELNVSNLSGNYQFRYAFNDLYPCDYDTANIEVAIFSSPEIFLDSLVCTATNDSYRVYATITGGDPSTYQITPANGVITGQQFVSNSIFENTPFSFTISDNVGCPATSNQQTTISGNYDCDCITESGGITTPLGSQDLCFNDSIIFVPDGNHRLDGNDGLMAVVHSAPGTSLGSVYASYPYSDSIIVRFAESTNIPVGERVYFSVIAGDAIGDSVDLADPSECLDVSSGIPVTLRSKPYMAANMLGNTTVCEGTRVDFRMELFTGVDPFTFTVNGDTTDLVYQNDTVSAVVSGAPQASFLFANLTDKFGCISDTVFTQVRNSTQKVSHEINSISCDPNNENYQVVLDIDRDFDRNMEQRGAVTYTPINDTLYQSEVIPSGQPYNALFNYEIGNCPDDTVSGIHTCPCGSFAGALADIPAEICADEVLPLQEVSASILEPNDALNFVVTRDTANRSSFDAILTEAQILAQDLTPGNTYFVAILVGDSTVNGLVASEDTCRSFSAWKKFTVLPFTSTSFNLSADSICSGSDITVFANFLQPLYRNVTIHGALISSNDIETPFSHQGTAGDFGTNFNLTATDSGVYEVHVDSVAYTGSRSCTEIIDETLTFYSIPNPAVSLAESFKVCPDPGVAAKIPVRYIQGIAPLDLTISNGNTVWVQTVTENNTDTILVDLPSGDYKLYVNSLTGNSSQQCSYTSSDTAFLRVLDKPSLAVSEVSDPICEDSQFDITLGVTGNDAPYSFAAFDKDNNPLGTFTGVATEQEVKNIAIAQQQVVQIRNFTSNEGCSGDDFQHTVNAAPRPVWVNPKDTNICEGTLARVRTSIIGNAPFTAVLEENGENKAFNTLSAADLITLDASQPENDISVVSITDALGCTSQFNNASFKVFRRPTPNSSLTFSELSGCGNIDLAIANTTTNVILDECNWSLNGTNVTGCDTVFYETDESEVLIVDYVLESNYGCRFQNSTSRNLVVNPSPKVAFTASPVRVSTISPVVTFSNQTPGQNEYLWRFDNLDSTTAFSPIYEFPSQDTGSYHVTLIATNEFGCVDSTSQIIRVSEQITVFIPNSFSPNGDGRNDIFMPGLMWDDIAHYELTVFNRWGQVVYQTQTNNTGWDGQFQNRPAPKGSYNFLLKVQSTFEEKVHTVHGTVLLVR